MDLSHEWLFEHHPDPMWVFDVQTWHIVAVNPAACELYGYAPEAFTQLTARDLRPAEDVEAFRQSLAINQSKPVIYLKRWRHLNSRGEILHVDVKARSLIYRGRASRLVVVRDVSEQVALEQERAQALQRAHESESILRLAGSMARLGAWTVQLEPLPWRLTWSDETARIHGEPPGLSPSFDDAIDYYVPEDRPRISAAFLACAHEGLPFDLTMRLRPRQGSERWVRAIGEPVIEAGRIVAVQGAFQDITELRAAQDASAALGQRLQATLESISDAFFTLSTDWRFVYLNPQAEVLLARSRDELSGENVWEQFPAAVGTQFEKAYEQAMRSGETVRFVEYYVPLATWFQVAAYPSADGLAVYFRDVTHELATQAELRLLQSAVSRQNDMLLITEAEPIEAPAGPRIVYVNEAFLRRTGYTRAETLGATPRLLQGPATDRGALTRIRRALAQWQSARVELINYTKAREPYWVEIDITPLANEEGSYTHWVAVLRDISDRKRAEALADMHEERLMRVSQVTHDVIWDWDILNDTIWWSDGIERLFGYRPGELDAGPGSWLEHIHPEDHQRVVANLHRILESRDENWTQEYRFLRADGRALTVMDRGFVLRNEQGQAVRMLGSMVDVTERRELDARLRQTQKLEAIGQLTGGVAHDFNNLLTVILGNAELIRDFPSAPAALRQLADLTLLAAERGAELTSRLLAFARRQPLAPQVVDLRQALLGMETLLRRTLSENIDMAVATDKALWTTEVDPGQLEVALLNLVLNARDAMPQGGSLTLEAGNVELAADATAEFEEVPAGPYVMVSVSDTGVGMPAEVVTRAFDPFFTTKEIGKGSGLGLSMVYGFVKQSGGLAKIYSERGVGTTVKLYFPRAFSQEVAMGADTSDTATIGGSEHILVVEDDTLVRQNLIGQLRGLGYRVTSASSAAQALEVLRGVQDVELLFTDVVMPGGMNGPQLAREAQMLYPGLKVLFTSGYTENAIVHQGRLDPGVHLLSKPYRRHEMALKVRKVLDESVG